MTRYSSLLKSLVGPFGSFGSWCSSTLSPVSGTRDARAPIVPMTTTDGHQVAGPQQQQHKEPRPMTTTDSIMAMLTPAAAAVTRKPNNMAAQLLSLAGADWTITKRPMAALIDQGADQLPQLVDAGPHVALVTDQVPPVVLAVPKRGYEPFQNRDLADLADRLHQAGAVGEPERVEVLRGGRVVLVHCRAESFTVGHSDVTERFTVLGMSHDGTLPLFVVSMACRMFCLNQLTTMASKGVANIRVRHTANMRVRLETAVDAVQVAQGLSDDYQRQAAMLADLRVGYHAVLTYWRACYALVSPEPAGRWSAVDSERNRWDRWDRKRARAFQAFGDTFHDEGVALPSVAGTAWLAFNAVTRWTDNDRVVRRHGGTSTSDAARWSGMFGSGARIKSQALKLAVSMLGTFQA